MPLLEDLQFDGGSVRLDEAAKKRDGVLCVVEGDFGITETENRNGRIYTNRLWEKVLGDKELQQKISERAVVGEPEHPNSLHARLDRVSHVVTDLKLVPEKKTVWGRAEILDTPTGRVMETLFRAGVKVGISSRGAGSVEVKQGKNFVKESDFVFAGFDFVSNPSAQNAYPHIRESLNEALEPFKDKILQDREYYTALLSKLGVGVDFLTEATEDKVSQLKQLEDRVFSLEAEKRGLLTKVQELCCKLAEAPEAPQPSDNTISLGEDLPDPMRELVDRNDELQTLAGAYREKVETLSSSLAVAQQEAKRMTEWVAEESKRLTEQACNLANREVDSRTQEYKTREAEKAQQLEETQKFSQELKARLEGVQAALDKTTTLFEGKVGQFQTFKQELIDSASELFGVDRDILLRRLSEGFAAKDVLECAMEESPRFRDSTLPLAAAPTTARFTLKESKAPALDDDDSRPKPSPMVRRALRSRQV